MDKLIRPLTPHEVRALQKPAVQEAVRLINDDLLRGSRNVSIPTPLAADVSAALISSCWVIQNQVSMPWGYTYLDLSEEDDTATAEAIGAELTWQVKA
jgi:hypothetical protein